MDDEFKVARAVVALRNWLKTKHVWAVILPDVLYAFNIILMEFMPLWTLFLILCVPVLGTLLFYFFYQRQEFTDPREEIYFCIGGAIVKIVLSPFQLLLVLLTSGFPMYLRDEKNNVIRINNQPQYDPFDQAAKRRDAFLYGFAYGTPLYAALYVVLLFAVIKFGVPALAKVKRIARIVQQMEDKALN